MGELNPRFEPSCPFSAYSPVHRAEKWVTVCYIVNIHTPPEQRNIYAAGIWVKRPKQLYVQFCYIF